MEAIPVCKFQINQIVSQIYNLKYISIKMTLDIFLTNSLGGKKEKFIPIDKKSIGMYVCGPTVYDDPHIGNARPLVIFDILFKILKNTYGDESVNYIRNITDVDDKIIKAAQKKNISINKLTTKITEIFMMIVNI